MIKFENDRLWCSTWILIQELHQHSWQTSSRNEPMPTKSTHSRKDNQKEKQHWSRRTPPPRETGRNNNRHLTCLSMMWKIFTAQIREDIYYSLTCRVLLPEELKGCRKGSRGTAELLYIDHHILNENKTRLEKLAMAWIDYKKAYDVVPQSWIISCLKMYKLSDDVIDFIKKSMKTWIVELTAGKKA